MVSAGHDSWLALFAWILWCLVMVMPPVRIVKAARALRKNEGLLESLYLAGARAHDVLRPMAFGAYRESLVLATGAACGLMLVPGYPFAFSLFESDSQLFRSGVGVPLILINLAFPFVAMSVAMFSCLVRIYRHPLSHCLAAGILPGLLSIATVATLSYIGTETVPPRRPYQGAEYLAACVALGAMFFAFVSVALWTWLASDHANDAFWRSNLIERQPWPGAVPTGGVPVS